MRTNQILHVSVAPRRDPAACMSCVGKSPGTRKHAWRDTHVRERLLSWGGISRVGQR